MLEFTAQHEFPAPPRSVTQAMTDPAFVESLELPDLAPVEVIEHTENGDGSLLRMRMRFTGSLDPIARRVIGGAHIAWVQEVCFETHGEQGTLTVLPEGLADRLRCQANYALAPIDTGTRRTLRGTLEVRVPLISGRAEKHILPGLLRRLDLEADALAVWLQTHP